jgi:hypothetical protein
MGECKGTRKQTRGRKGVRKEGGGKGEVGIREWGREFVRGEILKEIGERERNCRRESRWNKSGGDKKE